MKCAYFALVASLLFANDGLGQSLGPALVDMTTVRYKPSEVTTGNNVKAPAGTVDLIDGQFGKACNFSFVKSSGAQWFTTRVNPEEDWNQYEGFSFWVKGDGSNSCGGLEFIDGDDFGLRYGYCFPINSTKWVKVNVAWNDLIPELSGPLVDANGVFAPRRFRNVWIGKWFYWHEWPACSFSIERMVLEKKIARDTTDYTPKHAGLSRVLAKLKTRQPITIVTMGDSLSDKRHWANREKLWSEILIKRLKDTYGSEVTLVNPAIGGTTLSQNVILAPRWLQESPAPDLVVIWFGGNDWDTGVRGPRYKQYLRTAVDRLRRLTKGQADILVMTTCPGFGRWDTTAELSQAAYAVAKEQNTGFVDAAGAFHKAGSREEALKRQYWAWDNVHLGIGGHELIADLVFRGVQTEGLGDLKTVADAYWRKVSAQDVPAARAEDTWKAAGLGGSGGMFSLAVSSLDPQLMIVNCDMSEAYLSRDAGRTWRMIHHRMLAGNTRCAPVFHPTIAHRVYAADGGSDELRVSDDDGSTWRPLLNVRPPWRSPVTLLYVASHYPESLFVGTEDGAYATQDKGTTWRRCEGVTGKVLGVLVQSGDGSLAGWKHNFIATDRGIFRSTDLCKGYSRGDGLPKGRITSFSGATNASVGRFYATVECSLIDGRLTGGVYVSADDGGSWQNCMRGGLNVETRRKDEWAQGDIPQYGFLGTTDHDPMRVYVYCAGTSYWPPNHSTVYRSDDGGKTWTAVLFSDPRFAQLNLYNVEDDYVSRQWRQREQSQPYSLVVSRDNPDVVTMCNSGWLLRTENGGHNWRVCQTGPAVDGDAGGQAWRCNGLAVTTTWNYYIDPHQPTRHYICYTDIGLARSLDAGQTWIWQALSLPWHNTVYELAFDPEVPGRIWGAMSNTHDIPNDNVISGRHRVIMQGGVAVSNDYGITWQKLDLPSAPGLSVVLDPTSPKNNRVLYASLFEKGVYKSSDGGKTWAEGNRGLGEPRNMRCCKLHRCPDGTLLVLITAKKIAGQFTLAGPGLYRSADGGATWSKITLSLPLHWPKDFTVKASDAQTILLSASDVRGHVGEGGLYRTTNGGQTWTKLVQKEREHFGAYYHPSHPQWIYATCTEGALESGLYLSRDDGATWEPFKTLPFCNIQRVAFDPDRPREVILSTFGSSILRGPAEP